MFAAVSYFSFYLSNTFNHLFSWFERHNFIHEISRLKYFLEPQKDLIISEHRVALLQLKTNIRRCLAQMSSKGALWDIVRISSVECFFQICADYCQLSLIWKNSTIISIPKSTGPWGINDYRPVALTSLVMKTFQIILKDEVVSLSDQLDSTLLTRWVTEWGMQMFITLIKFTKIRRDPVLMLGF